MIALVIVFIAFFAFSCGEVSENVPVENGDFDEIPDEAAEECAENAVSYQKPELPQKPEIAETRKYDKNFECFPLPEPENGELILGDGCFSQLLQIRFQQKYSAPFRKEKHFQ